MSGGRIYAETAKPKAASQFGAAPRPSTVERRWAPREASRGAADHEGPQDLQTERAPEVRPLHFDLTRIAVTRPASPGVVPSLRPAAAPLPLQAKLIVGDVDDPLEKEADRVADAVLRAPAAAAGDPPAPPAGRGDSPAAPPHAALQRKCAACEAEDEPLQRKIADVSVPGTAGPDRLPLRRTCAACGHETKAGPGRAAATCAPAIVHDVLRSPGQPLDAATRAFMEPRFGHDFGGVRVHTDGRAAESAAAVGAQAFTVGEHVVFGRAAPSSGTAEGRRLLAHELTHVVQQAGPAARLGLRRRPIGQALFPLLQRQGGGSDHTHATRAAPPTPTNIPVDEGGSGPPKRVNLPDEIHVVWGGDPFTVTYKIINSASTGAERVHFDLTYTGPAWSGSYEGPWRGIPAARKAAQVEINLLEAGNEKLENARLVASRGDQPRFDIDFLPETGGNHVLSVHDRIKEFIDPGTHVAGRSPEGGRLHEFGGERNYSATEVWLEQSLYVRDEKLVAEAKKQSVPSEKPVTEPESPARPRPGRASASTANTINHIWYSDLTLGGYDDKFRVTVQPTSDTTALFGLTGMQGNQFVGGGGAPLKGTSAYAPSVVAARGDAVALDLHGGKQSQLSIADAVTRPTRGSGTGGAFRGFATDRHHQIKVSGADLAGTKVFEFDVQSGSLAASAQSASDDDVRATANAAATAGIAEQLALGDASAEAGRYESALLEMRQKAFKEGTVSKDLGVWFDALYLTIAQARSEQKGGKGASADLQRMTALAARTFGKQWAAASPDETSEARALVAEIGDAADAGLWSKAFGSWERTLRLFDEYLVEEQKKKDKKEYGRFTHEGFESLMEGKKRLQGLQGKPGLTRLAAIFHLKPKADYNLQRNVPTAIPLSIYYWREGGKWQLRDYTDPDRDPIDHDVEDQGGTEPPNELFEQLDHKSEYPYGMIHWAIPGGKSGFFLTTEKETTGEKVRRWAMRVATLGAAVGLALTGVGAVLDVAWLGAAGSVTLFVAAGAGVATAGADLIIKARDGTLRGIDVAIDLGQIVASLAALGQIPAGHLMNEMRGGAQLTGWAARAAAISKTMYVPLKYANIVGDTLTVIGVSADVYAQLQKIKKLPAGDQDREFLALVSTLFLTAGMSLISIKGAAKDILEGAPTIRVRVVDGVPTAFVEGATPHVAPGGSPHGGTPEPGAPRVSEPAAPRTPEGAGHEATPAAVEASTKVSGHLDDPSPRQIGNEAEYIAEHPELVKGTAPHRKVRIGEHDWQENEQGGWCRFSKPRCYDAQGNEVTDKIPDVAGLSPELSAKRRQIIESFGEFVTEDPAFKSVRAHDPKVRIGVQGSVVRGRVGNPRKPTFDQPFDPTNYDLDLFIISDALPKTQKVVSLPGLRDRLVRRFPALEAGLREGGKGLSVKVFRPGDAVPQPFIIFE